MHKLNCMYYSDVPHVNNDNLELLFVYIDNYKHFKKFSFGANAKYIFKYENNTLTIEDNPKYVKLFSDNINLKILCGKNGVGKTSILRLLQNIDKYPDCFMVYKNENGKYYTNKKNLVIIYNNNKPFYCKEDNGSIRSFHYSLWKDSLLDFDVPCLQEKFCKKYIDNKELFLNIINKNLLKNSHIPEFTHFSFCFSNEEGIIDSFINDIKKLFHLELSEHNVIEYAYKNPVKFEIMKEVCSWLICNTVFEDNNLYDNKFGNNHLDEIFKAIIDENDISHIENINKKLKKIILNSIDKKFIDSFKQLAYSYIDLYKKKEISFNIYIFIENIASIVQYLNLNFKNYKDICSLFPQIKLESFVKVILEGHYSNKSISKFFDFILENATCIKNKNDRIFESLLYKLENHFDFCEYPLQDLKLQYDEIEKLNSELRTVQNKINKTLLNQFPGSHPDIRFDLNSLFYPNIFVKRYNDNIYFNNLSSGQQLMLMNLINIHTTTIRACEKPKTLILNDDIDAHLHPDWCRKYLSIYTDSIKEYLEVYPEYANRKFNIIMATHSPIILSDVTNEYVSYLELDNYGNPKEVFSKENSFAGNIGQMYNDNFFMEHLIGDYSNKILEEVIYYIKRNSKEYLTKNQLIKNKDLEFIHSDKDCEKYLNAVGDKLLRNLLMDEYQIMKGRRQYEKD